MPSDVNWALMFHRGTEESGHRNREDSGGTESLPNLPGRRKGKWRFNNLPMHLHRITQVRSLEMYEGLAEKSSEGRDAGEKGAQAIPVWDLQKSYQIHDWKSHLM